MVKKSDLFSGAFSREKRYFDLYLFMSENDRLNSNLPDKFLIKKMNKIYDFILRKRLKIKTPETKTKKDVYKNFYKTLDILDKKELEYKNIRKSHPKRYLVDNESAKIYEEILKKAIKIVKPKNIGFIGFIFDYMKIKDFYLTTLFFPSKTGKIGESLIEMKKIDQKVNNFIKNKKGNYHVSISPKKLTHEMIHGFSTLEEGEEGLLPVHQLYFTNYKDFKKIPPKSFFESLKNMETLYGNFEDIKKRKDVTLQKLSPYLFILHSVLGTNIKTLLKNDEKAAIESLFEYLEQKYDLKINHKIPSIVKQKEQLFIKIMKELDKKTYDNKG